MPIWLRAVEAMWLPQPENNQLFSVLPDGPKLKIKRKKFTKNDVTVLKSNGLLGQYREGLFMNFSWYMPRLKE